MSEWQPIETAPKNERWILAFQSVLGSVPAVVRWDRHYRCFITVEDEEFLADSTEHDLSVRIDENHRWGLTHWMPLPDPPEELE